MGLGADLVIRPPGAPQNQDSGGLQFKGRANPILVDEVRLEQSQEQHN